MENTDKKPLGKVIAIGALFLVVIVLLFAWVGNMKKADAAEKAPAPTVTVTAEAETSDVCKEAAAELWDLLESMNTDVALGYHGVLELINGELENVYNNGSAALNVDNVEQATNQLDGVTSTTEDIAAQINASAGPKYQECMGE